MKTGTTMQIPKQVLVTDVVARDGFQNEDRFVSTEDLVHMLREMGIETGIDLDILLTEGRKLKTVIGHELSSQVARAGTSSTLHAFEEIRVADSRSAHQVEQGIVKEV
jgi:hypothetical protein